VNNTKKFTIQLQIKAVFQGWIPATPRAEIRKIGSGSTEAKS
jgi:hypothetical protein